MVEGRAICITNLLKADIPEDRRLANTDTFHCSNGGFLLKIISSKQTKQLYKTYSLALSEGCPS